MLFSRPVCGTKEDQEAINNIRQLLEYERFSRDNMLWDEMRKCYAKDSCISVSWFQGTGEDFVSASECMNAGSRKYYAPHKIHNTLIWVNGDRAVAVMNATIQIRREIAEVEYLVDSDMKLVTRVIREYGQWYIFTFDCIYDQDEMRPVMPSDALTVTKDDLAQYRASYACLSYLTDRTGMQLNQEMLGSDRPEQIEALYRDLDQWLSSEA